MKTERILCAAIWYKDIPLAKVFEHNVLPFNCDRGIVMCGWRHCQCIYTMSSMMGIRSVQVECGEHIQGFLTSTNRFVDRYEAMVIAVANNQLIGVPNNKEKLFSEDIY